MDAGLKLSFRGSMQKRVFSFYVTQTGPVATRAARLHLLAFCVVAACALLFVVPAQSKADPTTNVINGTQVPNLPSKYPWIVALVDQDDDQFCGGTLIAPYWVVTAAHCERADAVIYGRKSLSSPTAGERIPVLEQISHTGFNQDLLINDIQLLRLAHPPADLHVLPIATAIDDPPTGATVNLAGWGLTEYSGSNTVNDLREASLDVFSNGACDAQWGVLGVQVLSSQICAAHWQTLSEGDRQACNGDSGGPLVYTGGGGDHLVGLTSYGRPGCNGKPFPNVYTRLSFFNSWVHGNIDSRAGFTERDVVFGNTAVGSPSIAHNLSIVNAGSISMLVKTVTTSGAADFSVANSACVNVIIAPGATCPVTLQYTPVSQGLTLGQLNLSFAGGTSSIDLGTYGTSSGVSTVPPALKLSQAGKGVYKKGKFQIAMKASYVVPANVNQTTACANNVRLTADIPGVRKSLKTQGAVTWTLGKCLSKIKLNLPRKAKHKKVKFTLRFPGNAALAATEKKFKIRVK
jgi:chymotrypsin